MSNAPHLNSVSVQDSISERRLDILSRIDQAGRRNAVIKRGERSVEDITLVAVSKMQADERIQAMLDTGQTVFGENRVQEAAARWGERFSYHRARLSLRLIGPLQTNKAAQACDLFDVIETLDREKLAKALVNGAQKTGRLPKLYVQVNTGVEPQKAGILPSEVGTFVDKMRSEYDLSPLGLMCIPPVNQAPSPHFMLLSKLAKQCGLTHLSMGMSADFETAVTLGATSVRVGSALFGSRN